MRVIVLLCAIGGLFWALMAFGNAESAVHEIEALIGGLIATCGFGFFGVIGAIERGPLPPKPPKPPKS